MRQARGRAQEVAPPIELGQERPGVSSVILLQWISTILCVLLSAALCACTSVKPVRVATAPAGFRCDPTSQEWLVRPECSNVSPEVAQSYELHFAEFDDQGRPFAKTRRYESTEWQVPSFLHRVRTRVNPQSDAGLAGWRTRPGERISVVVFVHGWKHSARADDGNLRNFRELLYKLDKVEQATGCGRKVVGLYIGWRGSGTWMGDKVETLTTFWSRKLAATHIAQGSIQGLFASLEAIQLEAQNRAAASAPMNDACWQRLNITTVGHSFGGLIAYSALAPSIMREIALSTEEGLLSEGSVSIAKRPQNLTILVNPAVEGIRFAALMEMSRRANPTQYRNPILVSITSKDDIATRRAFPVGRTINTITKSFPPDDSDGRWANLKTFGHHESLQTHRLETAKHLKDRDIVYQADAACIFSQGEGFELRATRDLDRAIALRSRLGQCMKDDANTNGLFPRQFCDAKSASVSTAEPSIVLSPVRNDVNLNIPVWNIITAKPILDSHNDLMNDSLVEFIRQIYIDGTQLHWPRDPKVCLGPAGVQPVQGNASGPL